MGSQKWIEVMMGSQKWMEVMMGSQKWMEVKIRLIRVQYGTSFIMDILN